MSRLVNLRFKKITRRSLLIIILILVSVFPRFYNLGSIPLGLSVDEVRMGLSLSKFLGSWVFDPLVVRFPFALIGTASIFLFFVTVARLKNDFKFACIASLLLAITPWHIEQSRIYSPGLIIFFAVLLVVVVLQRFVNLEYVKIGKACLIIGGVVFLLSLFFIPRDLQIKVDRERSIAVNTISRFPSQLFANKIVESYRSRLNLLFENLDIGNYFFAGHPRERWGVEETDKLYFSFLPLLIIGFFKLDRKLKWILGGMSVLVLSGAVFLGVRGPSATQTLLFPILMVVGLGTVYLLKSKIKFILYVIIAFLFIETAFFTKSYFSGFGESEFSPRRPVYISLTEGLKSLVSPGQKVLVNEKLIDPLPFFEFYLGRSYLGNFEFRTFNISEEKNRGIDYLYVDVLSDDAKPNDPLYKKDGTWPRNIKVLKEFHDEGKHQTVVVYHWYEKS